MISENTSHLKLPLPHEDNYLYDDVPRLRDAFNGVDLYAQGTDQRLEAAERDLTTKADAAGTDAALLAVGQRLDQVAGELAGGIPTLSDAVDSAASTVAASSLAVKTAFDKGAAALTLAETAEQDAQSALSTCAIPDWSAALNYVGRCMVWHGEKIWLWRMPSGPSSGGGSGGVKAPGAAGSEAYWLDYAAAIAPVIQGGLIPVGHIEFLPFRYNQLPQGWYFANGTRYNTTITAVGAALKALPATLKSDWGMSLSGSGASETIAVPNWFYGGRGPTMRGADGSSRQVGSVEDGAIQNITGSANLIANTITGVIGSVSGAFSSSGTPGPVAQANTTANDGLKTYLHFYASSVVTTAHEVRMLNKGMTPAIFLGV